MWLKKKNYKKKKQAYTFLVSRDVEEEVMKENRRERREIVKLL
jgi:hypothetical protein